MADHRRTCFCKVIAASAFEQRGNGALEVHLYYVHGTKDRKKDDVILQYLKHLNKQKIRSKYNWILFTIINFFCGVILLRWFCNRVTTTTIWANCVSQYVQIVCRLAICVYNGICFWMVWGGGNTGTQNSKEGSP